MADDDDQRRDWERRNQGQARDAFSGKGDGQGERPPKRGSDMVEKDRMEPYPKPGDAETRQRVDRKIHHERVEREDKREKGRQGRQRQQQRQRSHQLQRDQIKGKARDDFDQSR